MSQAMARAQLAWIAACGVLVISSSVWAMQRVLVSKVHNYPNAPVEVKKSRVLLVETFTNPTQYVAPDQKAKTTRVRYANRAGLSASVFVMNGELTFVNRSTDAVEAVSMMVIPMDAFHQPLAQGSQQEGFTVQQMVDLNRGASKTLTWEQNATSADVYEVAVIVTKVRFKAGKVWSAPAEELIDVF
jgi:hypothetical protein